MNGNFKTCARGHYYSATLDHCPYCPSSNGDTSTNSATATMGPTDDSNRTMDVSGLGGQPSKGSAGAGQFGETKDISQNNKVGYSVPDNETKTSFVSNNIGENDGRTEDIHGGQRSPIQGQSSERTMFIDDEVMNENGQDQPVIRNRRKLVGWLVSYTLDNMGMDFKLYEGRNIIGRRNDCQITIADKTVSGNHAVILFRAGKYSITDQQSTQGTFVNEEDIELEPRYLKDGDTIRIGQTILKFRTSL